MVQLLSLFLALKKLIRSLEINLAESSLMSHSKTNFRNVYRFNRVELLYGVTDVYAYVYAQEGFGELLRAEEPSPPPRALDLKVKKHTGVSWSKYVCNPCRKQTDKLHEAKL